MYYNPEPAIPTGRTAEELAQDIQWFKEAFDLPILTTQELDADLALRKPKHRPQSGKGKSIEELMAALENVSEKEMIAADWQSKVALH